MLFIICLSFIFISLLNKDKLFEKFEFNERGEKKNDGRINVKSRCCPKDHPSDENRQTDR